MGSRGSARGWVGPSNARVQRRGCSRCCGTARCRLAILSAKPGSSRVRCNALLDGLGVGRQWDAARGQRAVPGVVEPMGRSAVVVMVLPAWSKRWRPTGASTSGAAKPWRDDARGAELAVGWGAAALFVALAQCRANRSPPWDTRPRWHLGRLGWEVVGSPAWQPWRARSASSLWGSLALVAVWRDERSQRDTGQRPVWVPSNARVQRRGCSRCCGA